MVAEIAAAGKVMAHATTMLLAMPQRTAETLRAAPMSAIALVMVMQAVRKSFITSFDRSDITDLIQSMDDAAQAHYLAPSAYLP